MRMRSRLSALACLISTTALAYPCSAQQLKSGEFSVQRFTPAPGPRNFLTVEGARTDGKMAFSLGLFGNYASEPLLVTSCRAQSCSDPGAVTQKVHVIDSLFTADLLASLTPIPRLQLGLRVPFSTVSGDGIQIEGPTAGDAALNGLKGSGLGDPMIEAKVRLVHAPDAPVVIGASAFATAPLGTATAEDRYIGDSSATFGGRAIVDVVLGRLALGGNLGAAYRKTATLGATKLGSELRYGGAAAFAVSPVARVIGEAFGASGFAATAGDNAFEVDFAGQFLPLQSPLSFTAGAGTKIIDGVGAPSLRAFAGILYAHEHSDQDGDGVSDNRDQCPTVAEDRDGYQDDDGCPDPDNDDDKILDTQDKCPNDPETINDYQDDDGCPDVIPDRDKDGIRDDIDKCPDDGGPNIMRTRGEFYGCPDSDHDGVPDKSDKCVDKPEDTDGFQDEDGCPDPDNDGDKILDADDQCVDQPEIYNGFQDNDGCPDEVPDRDKDGIPDSSDKCPNAPETYNGVRDDDGCPDGAALVEVTTDEIKIKDAIAFATGSDKIAGKRSFDVLNGVASAMNHHPDIFKIEVGGYADEGGDASHNLELSQRRAEAVAAYLVGKGVEVRRLNPVGHGSPEPAGNEKSKVSKAGKEKKLRVDFRIVSSTQKKPDVSEGEAAPQGAASPAKAASPAEAASPAKAASPAEAAPASAAKPAPSAPAPAPTGP